jgi:hypothetical protein
MPLLSSWIAPSGPIIQCGWFFAATVMPLVFGLALIHRYAWHNTKLATILGAALLGFMFFQVSLNGMLMDPRASQYTWHYLLLISAIVGFCAFLISLVVGFGGGTIVRGIRGDRE